MVDLTQTQLRTLSRTALVQQGEKNRQQQVIADKQRAIAIQQEAEQKAEYDRQKALYDAEVAKQQMIQEGYDRVNTYLQRTRERYGVGVMRGSYIVALRERYGQEFADMYVNAIKQQAKVADKQIYQYEQAVKAQAKLGVVSESVWNDIKDVPELRAKVSGYIPQSTMTAMAMYNEGKIDKPILSEAEFKRSGLSEQQRPLYNVIDTSKLSTVEAGRLGSEIVRVQIASAPASRQDLGFFGNINRAISENVQKVGNVLPVGFVGGIREQKPFSFFGLRNPFKAEIIPYYRKSGSSTDIGVTNGYSKTIEALEKRQILSKRFTAGQVADVGTYFIPYVAPVRMGLYTGQILEETGKGLATFYKEGEGNLAYVGSQAWEYTKQHPVEVGLKTAVVIGGAYSGFKAYKQFKTSYLINPPKRLTYKSEVISGTKADIVSKSKLKLSLFQKKKAIGQVRAGTTETWSPTNIRLRTTATARNYKLTQTSGAGGIVKGTIQRNWLGKTYTTRFATMKGGGVKYDIYKGSKLWKSVEGSGESLFGYAEPLRTSNIRLQKIKTFQPSKYKTRALSIEKKYTQDVIQKYGGKYKVSGKLDTTFQTERVTGLTPAKAKDIIRYKVGKDIYQLENINKVSAGKFSKVSAGDRELIKNVVIGKEGLKGSLSQASTSPVYKDYVFQIVGGEGTTTIRKTGVIERLFVPLKNQKAQSMLLPQISTQVPELSPNIKVPRVYSNFNVAPNQLQFISPGITSYSVTPIVSTLAGVSSLSRGTTTPRSFNDLMNVIKTDSTTKSASILKSNLIQMQTPLQISEQVQVQTSTATQAPSLRIRTTPRLDTFRTPVVPPVLASAFKKKLSMKSKAIGSFGIYARRKKVDRLIGTETSLDIAKIKLRKVLGSTISASGYISDIGTGTKLNIDLGMKYRKAKRDPLRIVEKRRFRLDTKSELFEIKSAKRKKKWW